MTKKVISIITILCFLPINIYFDNHPAAILIHSNNKLRPMSCVNSDKDVLDSILAPEEFIKKAAEMILEAARAGEPIVALNVTLSKLTKKAGKIAQSGLITKAPEGAKSAKKDKETVQSELMKKSLRNALDSLKTGQEKRRFTALLRQAVNRDLHKLGEEYEPRFVPPELPGTGTIWTVTTSPTIDIDITGKLIDWDAKKSVLESPGGGGINVSIALANRGVRARTIFFYAGKSGIQLLQLLRERRVYTSDAIALEDGEETRVPIMVSPDKRESLVPEGTPITRQAAEIMYKKLLDEKDGVKKGDFVVMSGSLAPGLPETFYADLGRKLIQRGAMVIVDTRGEPARNVLQSQPAAATIYSQNQYEFAKIVGVGDHDLPALRRKAREIIEALPPDQAIKEIVITLGPEGAFSVTRDRIWQAQAPQVETVSEIGAGDTSLAERVFRAWKGEAADRGFKFGVAAGTDSVRWPGTGGGSQAGIDNFACKIDLKEHVLVQNPFLRGEIPPASVVGADRLTAYTTSLIAAGTYAMGFIGSYHSFIEMGIPPEQALRFAQFQLNAVGQDVFGEVHDSRGIDPFLGAYEGRKNRGAGYLKAGRHLGVPHPKQTVYGIVDVLEASASIVKNEQDPGGAGGSSLYALGPLAEAFGPMPDELGAGLVIIGVPPDKKKVMDKFLPSLRGRPLDPDASVKELLRIASRVNNVGIDDLDVYIMNRPRLEEEYLGPLREIYEKHKGLRIKTVNSGSHDQALRAILGQNKEGQDNKRVPIFIGTSGSTEAVAAYLTAILFDTVAVGLKIYGEYSKSIGDIVGSLAKTLGELSDEQMAKVRQVVPEVDQLPKNISIRYLFSDKIKRVLRDELRREDTDAIVSPAGRLFHNESLIFPRTPENTPGIQLRNEQGDPIRLIPGVKWDDLIFSISTGYLVASEILGMEAVRERYPGYIEVPTLIVERRGGKTYTWVQKPVVNRKVLEDLLPQHFLLQHKDETKQLSTPVRLGEKPLVLIDTSA